MNIVRAIVVAITCCLLLMGITQSKGPAIELKNNYIEGTIKGNLNVLADCTVYLDSDIYKKPNKNGKFIFTDVKEGTYNMFVNHPYIEFSKYQVNVKKSVTKNNDKVYVVQAYEQISPFETSNLMVTNIVFEAEKVYDFLMPQRNFYLFNLFKSPIFLIFLFFLILMSVLPQMQKISESGSEESIGPATYKSSFVESLK
ncbi:hypothetical protein C922_00480 [Plasmodium inui San Antonio 1]|uniref:ER membrane protein complex subunit 7 beta-sandwich domain-containing protein n=1 Tax=Plasmodium inui San Antonio 1 TaxID=1237626 RepID=W7A6P4_9APIC|nr:hypothetical protein C922_00480 [Plasmodium inui San Antonio 1]EUD68792.1 hypothetical protein C922_00480 [Plasmodium inui San Antonio 1]